MEKNIEDGSAQGVGKLASVPAGGAVAVSAVPGSTAIAADFAPTPPHPHPHSRGEDKKKEGSNVGFGLFD